MDFNGGIPPPPAVPDPWDAVYDTEEQKYYFMNRETCEASWEIPAATAPPADGNNVEDDDDDDMPTLNFDDGEVEAAPPAAPKSAQPSANGGVPPSPVTPEPWDAVWNKQAQTFLFVNRETNQIKWELPAVSLAPPANATDEDNDNDNDAPFNLR